MFAITTAMRIPVNEVSLLYYSFLVLSDIRKGVAYYKIPCLLPFVLSLRVVLKMKMSMERCWNGSEREKQK
jgi:hypothetical protein